MHVEEYRDKLIKAVHDSGHDELITFVPAADDNEINSLRDLLTLCRSPFRTLEWIPVSERLPDDMQRVLIWFEYYRYGDYNCMYQTYGFGYVCDGKWSPFINGETGWRDARIIAWMPLPIPYKEGD